GRAKGRPRKVWENWSERDDVEGLLRWAGRFGPGAVGLLVFVYHLLPTVALPEGTPDLWHWRGRRYLIRAVEAGAYRRRMRVRSPRWGTVCLATADFRAIVRPFCEFASAECSLLPSGEREGSG
ncbi:MAG TPA: HYExAFE family protein, partial [Gemmataceae bacterium]